MILSMFHRRINKRVGLCKWMQKHLFSKQESWQNKERVTSRAAEKTLWEAAFSLVPGPHSGGLEVLLWSCGYEPSAQAIQAACTSVMVRDRAQNVKKTHPHHRWAGDGLCALDVSHMH
jgi:hypothetical protein